MASSVSDNLTITSVQARKAMLKAFKAKRPLFLWGPPGIGKSEVVAEALAKAHPLKRLGKGGDSAALAKFLLSDESSWITGQIFGVDGGRSSLT